jgi:hypothetical protein
MPDDVNDAAPPWRPNSKEHNMIIATKLTALALVAIAGASVTGGAVATYQGGASATPPASATVSILGLAPTGTGAIQCSFDNVAISNHSGVPGPGTVTFQSGGTDTANTVPGKATALTGPGAIPPGATPVKSGSATVAYRAGVISPAVRAQLVKANNVRPGTIQECGAISNKVASGR